MTLPKKPYYFFLSLQSIIIKKTLETKNITVSFASHKSDGKMLFFFSKLIPFFFLQPNTIETSKKERKKVIDFLIFAREKSSKTF